MSSIEFTSTSLYSLLGVVAILAVALILANALLPSNAKTSDRITFIWLAFDALIHFLFEGSWLWLSTFGRTVNNSAGPASEMWKEYSRADFRWGWADETVVSLELLTVFIAGPMCCYIIYQLIHGDQARHYWIVVLCTGEIYGGWMTFCPEWLTGSKNLNTGNPLHLWIYLFLMNTIWVFIPLWLMVDSYVHISGALRKNGTSVAKGKGKYA